MKTVMFMSGVPEVRIEKSLEMAAALGYRSVFCGREARNILSYSIFAKENGIFDHIHIDPMLETQGKNPGNQYLV